jgi:hypothetical protein
VDFVLKHSKICFGFISALGVIILILFFVGSILKEWDQIHILASVSYDFWWLMMFGGIALFTIGIIGIGRQKIKNHRNLFTAIAAFGIPISTFTIVFFAFMLIIAPASFHFPLRSKITNLSVINNSPLILSVDVKAITTADTRIEGAYVLNIDDYSIVTDSYMNPPFFELPAYSTKTLIFNFNETIPTGNYILHLSAWHANHGSLQFVIP